MSEIPKGHKERSNPVPSDLECLEYDVYGWYKFEDDADDVRRLGRQWLPLEQLVMTDGWEDKIAEYEEAKGAARTALGLE